MSLIDNNPKPVIAVDFDNTLCDSKYPACGDPIPGGREALEQFRALGYLILIYSCRSCHWHFDLYPSVKRETPVMEREAVVNMRNWLIEHNYPFDEIDDGSRGKPDYTFLIDDKGIRFENNWAEVAHFVTERTRMTQQKVNIVFCDDWEALYIGGIKKAEGHSLSTFDIFRALQIECKHQSVPIPDDVDGEVDFADRLEDVKFVPYPEDGDEE